MKFGKRLRATVDNSYEDWRPMFMSYKDLKKCIAVHAADDLESKDSGSKDGDDESDADRSLLAPPDTPAEKARNLDAVRAAERLHSQFFTKFKREVDKVNEFFLDKQEDYIIEHAQLSSKVEEYLTPGRATRMEVNRLRQRLTNLHGELVLLENFSTVNYTGFRKILKKHDKKTGLNVRNVYLKTVLVTPFFLSDTVRQLIRKTEAQLGKMDNIRKFRRPLDPSSLHSTPAQHSKQSSGTPPQLGGVTPATQIVLEPPRPHAFISPRSALWRLYGEARAYGARLASVRQSREKSVPPPPKALVELIDQVGPKELGLEAGFLNAVGQASNYCIAGAEMFSMGFFVLPQGSKLQIFKSHEGGAFICRNLRGRARLHMYRTAGNNSSSTVPSDHGLSEAGEVDFCVEEERTGMTHGPWPAVTCYGEDMHMEWTPDRVCAIFYVSAPVLRDDAMSRFQVIPLTPPRFRIIQEESRQNFTRVLC